MPPPYRHHQYLSPRSSHQAVPTPGSKATNNAESPSPRPALLLELASQRVVPSDQPQSRASSAAGVIVNRALSIFEEQQVNPPVILLIEMEPSRSSTDNGAKAVTSTHHSAVKYDHYFKMIEEYFSAANVNAPIPGDPGIKVLVQRTGSTATPVWSRRLHTERSDEQQYQVGSHRPTNLSHAFATPSRLGAFEVYLVTRYGSDRPRYSCLHSKLTSRTWPKLRHLVFRVEQSLHAFWADRALLPLAAQAVQEQQVVRQEIERWAPKASPQTLTVARARLAELEVADCELHCLIEINDMEGLRERLSSASASGSIRVAAKSRLASYDASSLALLGIAKRACVEVSDVEDVLEAHRDIGSDAARIEAEKRLACLNAADEALQEAAVAAPRELALLRAALNQHGAAASSSVRGELTALASRVEAADAELGRWRWSALGRAPFEARELEAAVMRHGPQASESVLADLVDIQGADTALRAALARVPLEAAEIQLALDNCGSRASTSVCLHVERQLSALRAADTELLTAMAKGAPEAQELAVAIEIHGPAASASVLALAPPKLKALEAADAALRQGLAEIPMEVAELQTKLAEHGPKASASVCIQVEQQLSELRISDAALKAAMVKAPAEAQDVYSSIEVHGPFASASVVQATQERADALSFHDAILQQRLGRQPLESAVLRHYLDEHRCHASASVVSAVVQRLEELVAADEALRAIVSEPPSRWKKRVTATLAAKGSNKTIAIAAQREESEKRSAQLLKYADLSAAVEHYGKQASASMATCASDAAVTELLEVSGIGKEDGQAAYELHRNFASEELVRLMVKRFGLGSSKKTLWVAPKRRRNSILARLRPQASVTEYELDYATAESGDVATAAAAAAAAIPEALDNEH